MRTGLSDADIKLGFVRHMILKSGRVTSAGHLSKEVCTRLFDKIMLPRVNLKRAQGVSNRSISTSTGQILSDNAKSIDIKHCPTSTCSDTQGKCTSVETEMSLKRKSDESLFPENEFTSKTIKGDGIKLKIKRLNSHHEENDSSKETTETGTKNETHIHEEKTPVNCMDEHNISQAPDTSTPQSSRKHANVEDVSTIHLPLDLSKPRNIVPHRNCAIAGDHGNRTHSNSGSYSMIISKSVTCLPTPPDSPEQSGEESLYKRTSNEIVHENLLSGAAGVCMQSKSPVPIPDFSVMLNSQEGRAKRNNNDVKTEEVNDDKKEKERKHSNSNLSPDVCVDKQDIMFPVIEENAQQENEERISTSLGKVEDETEVDQIDAKQQPDNEIQNQNIIPPPIGGDTRGESDSISVPEDDGFSKQHGMSKSNIVNKEERRKVQYEKWGESNSRYHPCPSDEIKDYSANTRLSQEDIFNSIHFGRSSPRSNCQPPQMITLSQPNPNFSPCYETKMKETKYQRHSNPSPQAATRFQNMDPDTPKGGQLASLQDSAMGLNKIYPVSHIPLATPNWYEHCMESTQILSQKSIPMPLKIGTHDKVDQIHSVGMNTECVTNTSSLTNLLKKNSHTRLLTMPLTENIPQDRHKIQVRPNPVKLHSDVVPYGNEPEMLNVHDNKRPVFLDGKQVHIPRMYTEFTPHHPLQPRIVKRRGRPPKNRAVTFQTPKTHSQHTNLTIKQSSQPMSQTSLIPKSPSLPQQVPSCQEPVPKCAACGKISLFICSGCAKITYCSPRCQLKTWWFHKKFCTPFS